MNDIKATLSKKTECYYTLKKGKKEESCVFVFDKKYGIIFKNKGDKSTFTISTEKKFITVRKNRGTKKISLDDGIEKLMKIFNAKPQKHSFSPDEIQFGTMFIEKIVEEIKRENIVIDPNVFNDLKNTIPPSYVISDMHIPISPVIGPRLRSPITDK